MKKELIKFIPSAVFLLVFFVSFINPLYAQELPNPLDITTPEEVLERITSAVLLIALPLSAIFIVYAGFLFVRAGGSEDKVTKAKQTLKWAIIGAFIVIAAHALATALKEFAESA